MRILYVLALLDILFFASATDAKTIGYPRSTEEANITYSEVMKEVRNKLGSNKTHVDTEDDSHVFCTFRAVLRTGRDYKKSWLMSVNNVDR